MNERRARTVQGVIRTDRAGRNRISKEAYARAVELLRTASAKIAERINTASEFSAPYLAQLKGEVDRALGEFRASYVQDFEGFQLRAEGLGSSFVKNTLALGDVQIATPAIPQSLIRAVSDFNADQITGVTRDAITAINRQLSVGVLGGSTRAETIKAISKLLPSPAGAGSITRRVERIVRTEVNRMHSIAVQYQMETAEKAGVRMGKYWLHYGAQRNPREDHIQAGRDYGPSNAIGVDEFFSVGGELAKYPRDPRLSAKQSVNCHCVSVPVVLTGDEKPGKGARPKGRRRTAKTRRRKR
jgi:hypothetical protein